MVNVGRLIKNTVRDFRSDKTMDISGVWIYCGLYGEGKTISMVREANKLKQKGINIYSNIGIKFQDGHIVSWRDLLDLPTNSCICLDELSNLCNSRDWQKMPPELFSLLTQNRKANVRIMATAQIFDNVDKQYRELSRYIIQCSRTGRLQTLRYYNQRGYNHVENNRHNLFRETYDITDDLYEMYDTYEYVKKLKSIPEISGGVKVER
jgi:hypothetical protein